MVEFELGKLKTVKIAEFKGQTRLDIRNYYEKDGEIKPTQKGISISREEWLKLLEHKDEISAAFGGEAAGSKAGKSAKRAGSGKEPEKKKLSPEKVSAEDLAEDLA